MNIVYIIGCGPSINKITNSEWKYLEDKETLSFATFPFKDKKTKYFMATESPFDNKLSLRRLKENNFMDTIIYTHKSETFDLADEMGFNPIMIEVRKGKHNFNGINWLHGNPVPGRLLDNFGVSIDDPLFNYRGQMSTALNLAYTFNPSEIRLIGVDLNAQNHFFDGIKGLEFLTKYHNWVEEKKAGKSGWSRDGVHRSASPINKNGELLVSVLEIIAQFKKELNEISKNIYVCSKDSKLYTDNILEYRGIDE